MGIFDSLFGKKPKPPAPRIIQPDKTADADENIDDELDDLNLGEAPPDSKSDLLDDDDDDAKPAKSAKPKKG